MIGKKPENARGIIGRGAAIPDVAPLAKPRTRGRHWATAASRRALTKPRAVGREAEAGSVRGDFSMSSQHNIIHASDAVETAKKEAKMIFKPSEIFKYRKDEEVWVYARDEREK